MSIKLIAIVIFVAILFSTGLVVEYKIKQPEIDKLTAQNVALQQTINNKNSLIDQYDKNARDLLVEVQKANTREKEAGAKLTTVQEQAQKDLNAYLEKLKKAGTDKKCSALEQHICPSYLDY